MINPESKLAKGVTALSLATTIGLGLSACGGEEGPGHDSGNTNVSPDLKGVNEDTIYQICVDPQINKDLRQMDYSLTRRCQTFFDEGQPHNEKNLIPGKAAIFGDLESPLTVYIASHPKNTPYHFSKRNYVDDSEAVDKQTFEMGGYDCLTYDWGESNKTLQCEVGDGVIGVDYEPFDNGSKRADPTKLIKNIVARTTEISGVTGQESSPTKYVVIPNKDPKLPPFGRLNDKPVPVPEDKLIPVSFNMASLNMLYCSSNNSVNGIYNAVEGAVVGHGALGTVGKALLKYAGASAGSNGCGPDYDFQPLQGENITNFYDDYNATVASIHLKASKHYDPGSKISDDLTNEQLLKNADQAGYETSTILNQPCYEPSDSSDLLAPPIVCVVGLNEVSRKEGFARVSVAAQTVEIGPQIMEALLYSLADGSPESQHPSYIKLDY